MVLITLTMAGFEPAGSAGRVVETAAQRAEGWPAAWIDHG